MRASALEGRLRDDLLTTKKDPAPLIAFQNVNPSRNAMGNCRRVKSVQRLRMYMTVRHWLTLKLGLKPMKGRRAQLR